MPGRDEPPGDMVALDSRFQTLNATGEDGGGVAPMEEDDGGDRRRKGLRATLRKNAPLLPQAQGGDMGGSRRSGLSVFEEIGKRWDAAMPGFMTKRSSSVGLTANGGGAGPGSGDGRPGRAKALSASPQRPRGASGDGKEDFVMGGSVAGPINDAAAAAAAAAVAAGRAPGEEGLRRVAFKFTTVSEGPDQPSFIVDTEGATVGRGPNNKMSVASDMALVEADHAFIVWTPADPAVAQAAAASAAAAVSPSSASVGAAAAAAAMGGQAQGGHFYLHDGGTGSDFAAAVRIRIGTGSRQWPLRLGSRFSAGNSVFRVVRVNSSRPGGDVRLEETVAEGRGEGKEDTGGSTGERKGEEKHRIGNEGKEDEYTPVGHGGGGARGASSPHEGKSPEKSENFEKAQKCADKDGMGPPALPSAAREVAAADGGGQEDAMGEDSGGGTVPGIWLESLTGPLKGETKLVGADGATLGRATDNAISIADKELSRRHSKVEFEPEDGIFYLCDVGSLNGTYMQLVGPYAGRFRLSLSDHILVGRTGFSVNRFDYGVSERIGARPTMEDKSTVIQDLAVPGLHGPLLWPQTFIGVFDGHGGCQASEYLWHNLHKKVAEALEKRAPELTRLAVLATAAASGGGKAAEVGATGGGDADGDTPSAAPRGWGARGRGSVANGRNSVTSGAGGSAVAALDAVVHAAITEACRVADEEFITTADNPEAGSTATTCLILGSRIHVANVGDSRTVLVRGGNVHLASKDHKPQREDEHERIRAAGGFIVHKRVMGELAVSRAFGDAEFKRGTDAGPGGVRGLKLRRAGGSGGGGPNSGAGTSGAPGTDSGRSGTEEPRGPPLVSSQPEFEVATLTPKDEFLLLGCDGLFDVYNNAEAIREARDAVASHGDVQRACETLTNTAIQERGTRDNVTVVIVVLNKWWGKQGKS